MEESDIETLSGVLGGRFNLVTIYCRRLRDLQRGMPPLIEDTEGLTHKEIVVEEIRQEKVWLLTGEEAAKLRIEREKKAAKDLPAPEETEEKPPAPPVL